MDNIRAYSASGWGVPLQQRSDDFSSLLTESLLSAGYRCEGGSTPGLFDWFTIEPTPSEIFRKILGKNHFTVLIVLEPRAVSPLLYKKFVRRMYKTVFVQSETQRVLPSDKTWNMGHLPSYDELLVQLDDSNRKDFSESSLGLINENKFSMVRGELYSARRLALNHLVRKNIDVTVAGKNWTRHWLWSFAQAVKACLWSLIGLEIPTVKGMSKLSLRKLPKAIFAGQVDSQVGFHREHSIALIIENDASYVSEKLFNAIVAGSTPIYVGPDLREFGITDEITIPSSPSCSDILDATEVAMGPKGHEIRDSGRSWISQRETHSRWSKQAGAQDLATKLVHLLGGTEKPNDL